MFSIWVATFAVLAATATSEAGYEYKVPTTVFGGSQHSGPFSAHGSTSSGYGYRPQSNYATSSYSGYNSAVNSFGSHGASNSIGSHLPSTGYPTGSYGQSTSTFGTDSNKKYVSGVGSSQNTGYYQTGSGSNTGSGSGYYQTGSGSNTGSGSGYYQTGSGSNTANGQGYNVLGSSQSNYNVGASSSGSSYGTGSNNYYGSTGSSGSNHNFGTGSGHQLTEYQTTFESTSDTSHIDKIGSYYESASAANHFQSSNQYNSASKQEYYIQNSQQPTQVFKHFYVLSAPEEPEPVKQRQPIVLPPAQKHYKIIFIKAPTQPAPSPQIITVPQQNEEKTIVYVLVKKPEDVKNIALPKFESKAPTKPEVFFIKYNDKSDSQALIDNIVNDYNKGGVKASFSNLNIDSKGTTLTASQPTSTSEDTSGSLDSILGLDQSLVSGGSESSSQLNKGTTTLINHKGGSITTTGSGTNLQSTSNSGTGSIYVPSGGYNAYNKDFVTGSTIKPSIAAGHADVSSSASAESIDNRFNNDVVASSINQNVGGTFAAAVNDESSSVSSIISSSNLENSALDASSSLDTSLSDYTPTNLPSGSTISNGLESSTAFGSGLNSASNAAASSGTSSGTIEYNSGTSYNSYNTAKPSVSFGTNYSNLQSSSGGAVGSGKYSSSSAFGSKDVSSSSGSRFNSGYNSFGSTTANVLSSGAQSTYDSSLVSPSQGVPHETYGPPKFKVF